MVLQSLMFATSDKNIYSMKKNSSYSNPASAAVLSICIRKLPELPLEHPLPMGVQNTFLEKSVPGAKKKLSMTQVDFLQRATGA